MSVRAHNRCGCSTMRRVAELAGLSTSTVSRVVNQPSHVPPDTARLVRQAMSDLGVDLASRRKRAASAPVMTGSRVNAVALLVIGTSEVPIPSFSRLLCGVSDRLNAHRVSLALGFCPDPAKVPEKFPDKLADRKVEGLLLHGQCPTGALEARLRGTPTVWLMADGRRRPAWGDQVMSNDAAIGELAAQYLLRRGHRRVAFVGSVTSSSMQLQRFAFTQAAKDAGASPLVFDEAVETAWLGACVASGTTGLFLATDRLLPLVDAALRSSGRLPRGEGGDVEIISGNADHPCCSSLHPSRPVIDVQADAVGRHGVERLLWRVRNADVVERVRTMVEPTLLAHPTDLAPRALADALRASGPNHPLTSLLDVV